jgi:ribosomal protein S6--L-glutamate ligase
MNIAILSTSELLYSTQSLVAAAERRNHDVEVIDPTYCNVLIENNKVLLQYHNEVINDIDAIIPRIGVLNTYFGTSILRHFEAMDVYTAASSLGISQSRDKWISFQLMAKAGLPLPKTTLGSPAYLKDFLKDFGNGQVIIKILEGTHGNGVILCENYTNALSTVETLQGLRTRFVMQEFIAESRGTDIRAIVVGNKVIAAMKRSSKDNDFRSNLHQGGSATTYLLSDREREVAIGAAKALQLDVCGVDILQSKRGPLILEVNSTPGLEGIETASGISVAGAIIEYVEKTASLNIP